MNPALVPFGDAQVYVMPSDLSSGIESSGLKLTAATSWAAPDLSATLQSIADYLGAIRTKLAVPPKEVEIEFKLSLSADAKAWIINGKAESSFSVKLKWQ